MLLEVEVASSKELLLSPIIVSRNERERVLIEASVNAVRVSIAVKQGGEREREIQRETFPSLEFIISFRAIFISQL